ncbi:potassium transporter Kup [Blastochloris sulfoviridis]|uniref:Probable potassium transport system protein Kup n=1 Tax=Blastochloris sulfoviridis TaxID=50712 RepID=A0A5M6HMT3_9HYPH|nr:potassium transporter Kup [Blastochloris sulfoviridis]KAA5597170.1 potassium transporter Kup [Blastochloris sulfoviridis]
MSSPSASPAAPTSTGAHPPASFAALVLGSVGVVYGDIGTSPLYAFREALAAASGHSGAPTETAVFGVMSLILWALILIVTVKYVLVLLRADNDGEGGTLSLMALAQRAIGTGATTAGATAIFLLGTLGAALFYGDAIITPAISVLSAVEGLKLVTPSLAHAVIPISVAIIIGLFAVQSFGTAKVAAWFGPITVVWFLAMAAAGLPHIANNPAVFGAFNPLHAVAFMWDHGMVGLLTLGAVFLAVTGAEALYADLGHFGRRPIQAAWIVLVLPALVLNYLGQAALILANPAAVENPFYLLVPDWALPAMVLLATAATIIASQAVITGAFSLTRQAVQLGVLPRMEIRHTSEAQSGQIFIPSINLFLALGVLLLIALFRNSSALASAYGIAVTGTMVVTALMAFIVISRVWNWGPWVAAAVIAPFLFIDATFLAANLMKFFDGGWAPVALGGLLMLVMLTWRRGSRILFEKTRRAEVPLPELIASLAEKAPLRVPGTAVFLTADPDSAPTALLHSLKHYKVLHDKVVILSVVTAKVPHIADADRVRIEAIDDTFSRVILTFGFSESPNVPRALAICRQRGWKFDIMSTSFFLSRRTIRASAHFGMPLWQDRLFIILARNAGSASDFFQIPTGRVVEIGTQITV